MLDLGLSKLAIIGVVALVVIGPEKLPRVARMAGTLLGRAQRYVNDVKAEVSREMEFDDLRKMKDSVQSAATDFQHSVENNISSTVTQFNAGLESGADASSLVTHSGYRAPDIAVPRKNWRLKQAARPIWYKKINQQRTRISSGAARVVRHRPATARSTHTFF